MPTSRQVHLPWCFRDDGRVVKQIRTGLIRDGFRVRRCDDVQISCVEINSREQGRHSWGMPKFVWNTS